MDLAQTYHTFAKKMYPTAIRIADRYHVILYENLFKNNFGERYDQLT